MRLDAAILCDYASVRENLLTVVGGGITSMTRANLPAPVNASVGMMLAINRMEADRPHEVVLYLQDEDGDRRAEARSAIQVGDASTVPVGQDIMIPIAIPLSAAEFQRHGAHSIEIMIDGAHQRTLPFRVVGAAPEPEDAA